MKQEKTQNLEEGGTIIPENVKVGIKKKLEGGNDGKSIVICRDKRGKGNKKEIMKEYVHKG